MTDLTSRQAEILAFIRAYWKENCQGPTRRTIAMQFNFRSENSATEHIEALEKKGFVSRSEAGNVIPQDLAEFIRRRYRPINSGLSSKHQNKALQ